MVGECSVVMLFYHQCLIVIQLDKLQAFADKINYKLKIDPARLQETLEGGDAEAKIKPIFIEDMKYICEYSPYEHSK